MPEILGEKESKQLQALLAWGSVAYAAGFLTVMVHTARLGIPIIELIEPIYIWIGLPLAIVIFSTRWLLKAVRIRYDRFRTEIKESTSLIIETLKTEGNENNEDISKVANLASDIIVTVASFVPLGAAIISISSNDAFTKQLRNISIELATKLVKSPQYRTFLVKQVRISKETARLFFAINRFINFVVLVSLVPIGSFIYIYNLYPLIPQSLGGGRPTSVVITMDRDSIPSNSIDFQNLFTPTDLANSSTVVATDKVELLYSTNEQYYISKPDGTIVSISKNLVQAIIWYPEKQK